MGVGNKILPAGVEKIESPVMDFSPTTEAALIFLFGSKAKELGFIIQKFNSKGIDCRAIRKTSKGWEECRIEFELFSQDFITHKHRRNKCDLVICWEDNCLKKEKLPEILELRPHFVKTRQVWIMAYDEKYYWGLEHYEKPSWSVPKGAHKGDLFIMYCKSPKSAITHLLEMKSNVEPDKEWKWGGNTKKIAKLKREVKFAELKTSPHLKDAHFIKMQMQGRFNVTQYWHEIRKIILAKNPGIRRKLQPWLS